jgi:EAL domain-containing protein (putative c-di-GMP-specific phosphodiesterase class I)
MMARILPKRVAHRLCMAAGLAATKVLSMPVLTIRWVIGSTLVALIFMGSLSIAILRDVALRLRRLGDSMLRLSRNDTTAENASIKALHKAKAIGRGSRVVFRPEHAQALKERRRLESEMAQALSEGQFQLHYQPIVDLATGRISAFEALMRWNHPTCGMIPPLSFIPIAEESGFIVKLGAWSLRRAMLDAATWPDHIKVAVNLSVAQFGDTDLGSLIARLLAETRLAPRRLEIEVTETLLLKEESGTLAILHDLRGLGVGVALDDFGTGFASLSYLRSFPFDKLKIDRSFIKDLPSRADCGAIVRAVSGLARTLEMGSVAEGIETMEHLDLVAGAGIAEAQGYLLGRPSPLAALPAVIAECEALMARRAAYPVAEMDSPTCAGPTPRPAPRAAASLHDLLDSGRSSEIVVS